MAKAGKQDNEEPPMRWVKPSTPAAWVLFVSIHLFALTFNALSLILAIPVFLLVTLPSALVDSMAREDSPQRQEDLKRWTERKLPRHLAVVWAPSRGGRIDPRRTLDDVRNLSRWAVKAGVKEITLYDELGFLHKNAAAVLAAAQDPETASQFEDILILFSLQPPKSKSDACFSHECRMPYLVPRPEPETRPIVKVNVLSSRSGQRHLAAVAQSLASAATQGLLTPREVTEPALNEKLESSLITSPDLLVVLGGRHLELRGFPPWHLRVTEIYHAPSKSFIFPFSLLEPPLSRVGLGRTPRGSYSVFRGAMDLYAGCEQRWGR